MSHILTNRDLGSKLKQLRKEAGLTQERLAEMVNVSTRQIQKYEAGQDNISTEKLQELAAILAVPVQCFFSHTGEIMPLQVSEQVLLDSFRSIQNANVRESILQVVIHAAKVKE